MGHAFFLLSRRRYRGSVPRARSSLLPPSGAEGGRERSLARILLCFLALDVSSCIAAAARPTLFHPMVPHFMTLFKHQ